MSKVQNKPSVISLHCSPQKFAIGASDGTCYTKKELELIAKNYNKTVQQPDQKLPLVKNKKVLHQKISEKLQHVCKDREDCWLEQDFLDSDIRRKLQASFRPLKPPEWYKNERTWLNNYDINYVMKQYEQKYKDFVFLGVYPIDFYENYPGTNTCIGDFMCMFNIKNMLEKKKTRFGLVLNLHTHDKPGSHWVALYCDCNVRHNNYGIYYYDSVGIRPNERVRHFMNTIENQAKELFSRRKRIFAKKHNVIQKQFKNTECGMFCLVYLTQCLKDVQFDSICSRMPKDDTINSFRNVLYRPSPKLNKLSSNI